MLTYDPRTISTHVYQSLSNLQQDTINQAAQKEQKSQAVELYTYIATWGLLRLKAEEFALSQNSKKDVVKCFFQILGKIAFPEKPDHFLERQGLNNLTKRGDSESFNASEYLGLTGLALQIAREFAFWAEAVYPDVQPTHNQDTTAG
ncbi:hypothetical protein AA650_03585 [Anabaena sp. WA102]|jgi:hypothetical protein|uniref:hypothetical protein n=1 Tax=Anabaena sp. WA102 TaxID=1647413 RepID=UPI0006AC156A|nr:hypothetical protein [Anabaena sp. WA102]ALB39666.1 hypothetical protein AA650_03585 [Anabaena sp. WA102]